MVLYKVEDTYYNDILKGMNNLRNSFYDITLKIGDEKVHAQRTVLVTGSDYFKSMFVGPFAENKSEIDLTDLTDKVDMLECVISFLYLGEIEINEANIETLMKLSSFLMITKLQGFCSEFIVTDLNLSSCLKYYFSCLHYGFPDLERKIGNILQSRFHDSIIFHEEAVFLRSNELSHLLGKDYLKFCRVLDLLNFLLRWISAVKEKDSHLNDEHLSFLSQFVDYVASLDKDGSARKKCEQQFDDIKKEVRNLSSDIAKTFQNQIELEIICFKAEPETRSRNERKSKTDCLKKLKSSSGENKSKQRKKLENHMKDAVILICPRKVLLDKGDTKSFKNLQYHVLQYNPIAKSFQEPVLDVLAFIPEQKTWYFVNCMYDRSIMSDLLRDSGDSWFTQVGDRIFHLHEEDSDPISFNLDDSHSRRTWYTDYHEHWEHDPEDEDRFYCEKSNLVEVNGSAYVVHKLSIRPAGTDGEDDPEYEYSFCCCKLLPDDTWDVVFRTETFRYDHAYSNDDRVFVSYTESSKEMIIVYYSNNLISCYVVDMFARGGPKPRKVYPADGIDLPAPDKNKKWWEAKIIEGTDRFYILELEYCYDKETSGKAEQREVFCTHEYVFGSHAIIPSNIGKVNLDYQVHDFKKTSTNGSTNSFMGQEYIAPDKKSVWVFDGNEKGVSSLQEITMDDGQLKVRAHTPPPTCSVNAMFAAKLSSDYLAGKRFINKYMLVEDDPAD